MNPCGSLGANANTPDDTAHEHLEQFCAKVQASLAAALGADRAALIVGRFAAAVIGTKREIEISVPGREKCA